MNLMQEPVEEVAFRRKEGCLQGIRAALPSPSLLGFFSGGTSFFLASCLVVCKQTPLCGKGKTVRGLRRSRNTILRDRRYLPASGLVARLPSPCFQGVSLSIIVSNIHHRHINGTNEDEWVSHVLANNCGPSPSPRQCKQVEMMV
jgi:hypothetical protein